MTRGEKAFLDVIAYAEGTLGISNNGYDVLVNPNPKKGAKIIKGWTVNTDIVHGLNKWLVTIGSVKSTAAGRYQFIGTTWVELNNNKNVPINKANQDKTAIKYAKRKLGNDFNFIFRDLKDFQVAANKLIKIWDSFRVKSHAELYEIYVKAYNMYV